MFDNLTTLKIWERKKAFFSIMSTTKVIIGTHSYCILLQEIIMIFKASNVVSKEWPLQFNLTPNKRKVEIEKKIIIDRPKRDEVRGEEGSCKGVETPLQNYRTQKNCFWMKNVLLSISIGNRHLFFLCEKNDNIFLVLGFLNDKITKYIFL